MIISSNPRAATDRSVSASLAERVVERLLNEDQAAALLNLKVKTLQRWRWAGKGPVFRKIGRAVRYDRRDLEAFIASARRTSTSDTGADLSAREAA